MKPAGIAATPWAFSWRHKRTGRFPALAAPLLLSAVLLVYGQSVVRSPAFGQLADQGYHLASIRAVEEAWSAGEVIPQWDAHANGGRGAPMLYPPLFSYAGGALTRLGLDPVDALRWAFLASVAALFGGALYYGAALGTVPRAAVAAAVVCLLPGATFTSLGRGMYPAFLALAFFALAGGALERLRIGASPTRSTVALAAGAAGLILTHTLTAYMALWLLAVAGPWLAPALGIRNGLRVFAATGAALLLSAWYWVPMLAVAAEAQTGYLAEAHSYADSLLGFAGGSRAPLHESWDGVAWVGRALSAAQLLLAAALAWSLRGSATLTARCLPAAIVFVMLASTAPSGEWLAALPGFDKLQFAWRWQGPLAVLCGAALAAAPPGRRTLPLACAGLCVALFAPLSQPAERPPHRSPNVSRTYTLAEQPSIEPAERSRYLQNRIEMRPLGADRLLHPPGPPGAWSVVEGDVDVALQTLTPAVRVYRIEARTPAALRLRTYHFSGWKADIDGREIPIVAEPHSGLQRLSVPAGSHRLTLRYCAYAH